MIKYRVVPFKKLNTNEQMFTLVKEYIETSTGKVIQDDRHQMTAEDFRILSITLASAIRETEP